MKLSTAIRRGRRHQGLLAHAVGTPHLPPMPSSRRAGATQHTELDFTSCALGTAWHGFGFPDHVLPNGALVLRELSAATGIDLLATFVMHPVTELPMSLAGGVFSLHTSHSWTDEEIIAWLADLGY